MRIHKISRRNFMQITGISALAMGLAACGGSSSSTAASSTASPAASSAAGNASYKITIAHQQDETDSMHLGAVEFQKYVQEKSNGQIEVEIFPNGQLGPEVDIIQSILSQGGCDITFTGETMQTYEPDLGMIGMPYLIQSDEHMDKVLNGEVGQELEGLMEAAGMKCLAYYTRGPRYITSNRKITCVADCNNLVIRTPAAAMTVSAFEALGAKPTPMALAEVFTSLQQGTIEAQENPLAMIYTKSFFEVQKYLILTAHLRAWVYVAMGKAQFDALPAELQQVVMDGAAAAQAADALAALDRQLSTLQTTLGAAEQAERQRQEVAGELAKARSTAQLESARANTRRKTLEALNAALTASEAELAALADADTRRVELEAEAARLAQRETALNELARSLTECQHRNTAARTAQEAYRQAAGRQTEAHSTRDMLERAFLDAQAGLLAQTLGEGGARRFCAEMEVSCVFLKS